MENIIITNDGFFVQEYNSNLNILEVLPISEELSYYYSNLVELSPDLTFGGLFKTLEPYIHKLEDHFLADTRKWPLLPYFEAIKSDVKEDLGFMAIQFSWSYDYWEHFDRKAGKIEKYLDNYIHLNGLGEDPEHGIINYSLSFVELNNIKNVPVKIIRECQIYGTDHKTIVLEFEKDIKLRDFIGGLLHEITFYGSPDQMKEKSNILLERSKNFDISESISWESIQLQWLAEELGEALEEEDYEWADRVRKEIEKVSKSL